MFKFKFWLHGLLLFFARTTIAQSSVKSVDLDRYAGKWYVIGFLPTMFDKNWDYTTESYTNLLSGDIDIYTTYRKPGDTKDRVVRSKGFPDRNTNSVSWKVQFVWPFKAGYLIEELPDDYSYVVVGHPKRSFLYIMSRNSTMDETLYKAILGRCEKLGYPVDKVRKQKQ